MPETMATLLGFERRITRLEAWREQQEAAASQAPPSGGRSSRIIELLLSPPFLKIVGAAVLLGAGFKLDQAGEIISRLFG